MPDAQDDEHLRSLVRWATGHLDVDDAARLHLRDAIAHAVQDRPGPIEAVGLEVHHDGSGRVDFSLFRSGSPGRHVDVAGARFDVDQLDVEEYDLLPDGARLAGVFHRVLDATLPDHLADGGTPVVVGDMVGRGGQLRLLVPVPDPADLPALAARLRAAGATASAAERLLEAAPLCTSATSLRLALEYIPGPWRLGPRLGLEAVVHPGAADVYPVLSVLGVPDRDAERLRTLASGLPRVREWQRRVPGLPGIPLTPRLDSLDVAHVGIVLRDGSAVVKTYLTLLSGPARTAADMRDARVRRAGAGWSRRVRWAARQLPLLAAGPDDAQAEAAAMREWGEAVDPGGRDLLDVRLARDGLDRPRAVVAISERVGPPDEEPTWWAGYRLVVDAFMGPGARQPGPPGQADDDLTWLAEVEAEIPADARALPFAHLLWPIVAAATASLAESSPRRLDTVAPQALAGLQHGLLARASMVAAPVLLDLMWEPVPFGQRLIAGLGEEPVDAPRERYAAFCRRHRSTALAEVLDRYPVLGGLLATVVGQWSEAVSELLDRLAADRADLERLLGVPGTDRLDRVRMSAGDTHNGGRAVCVLGFGSHRVVYKPRAVGLEEMYSWAVAALGGTSVEGAVRAPAVLAREDDAGREYGWVEFIAHLPCDPAELPAFYRNAGCTLALLHALAATDCHTENLIAHGTHLVLVDAETLLDAATDPAAMPVTPGGADPGDLAAMATASVLRMGMLPAWLWLEGERTAVDVTALGVAATAPGPVTGRGWRAVNTDLMVRGRTAHTPPHPTSLPTPPGVAADLPRYVDALVAGFAEGHRALRRRRTRLSLEVRRVAGARRRVVVRPTYVYAALLQSCVEPSALSSARARAMVLERLTRAHLAADDTRWPLVAAEQDALQRMDVPYFETSLTAGGTTWWGGGRLDGWPAASVLDEVLRRLDTLDEEDSQRQSSVIRASIAAAGFRMTSGPPTGLVPAPRADVPADADLAGRRCLSAVADAAVTAGGDPAWMGVRLLPDGVRANAEPIGLGLYDGRAGLAVALGSAAAADPLVRILSDPDAVTRFATAAGPGMTGVGGVLRGLDALARGAVVDPRAAADAIASLLASLSPERLSRDVALDHISGAAGLAAPLARLLAETGDSRTADLLDATARVLVRRQDAATGGWATLPARAPLTGLAHGAAGIALALAEAAVALEQPTYLDAALRGLAYEASTFDVAEGNWPDLRDSAAGGFMLGWCAGAPGIALTRLRLLQLLPDVEQAATWREEMAAAARTTATAPLLGRDHLCCGNLGRVVILRTLAAREPSDDWDEAANGIVAGVLERSAQDLPRTVLGDGPDPIVLPGLMTGLSGIGRALADDDPSDWVLRLLL